MINNANNPTNAPILGAQYDWQGNSVRVVGIHNWPACDNLLVDLEYENEDGELGVLQTEWSQHGFHLVEFPVREHVMEHVGWPGDFSGEDDFADFNQNEGNDW